MILVEATPEHFGIEQDEDMLFALSKCCGARLSVNEDRRVYECNDCAAEWPVFGIEDYPIVKYRDAQGWASIMTCLKDGLVPTQEGNRWWVSKWLGVPYDDVQLEIS